MQGLLFCLVGLVWLVLLEKLDPRIVNSSTLKKRNNLFWIFICSGVIFFVTLHANLLIYNLK